MTEIIADLYIRVSTDEQADKGYSQRSQEEMLRKYCGINNITIRLVMIEDYTARTFNRPEWKKYLIDLKKNKNKVNLVLFVKWDRFSRITSDAYQMIDILRKLGVEPQATEQPLDTSIPENKIMLAFYLAMPEAENERRALNVVYGMRRARKEGRYMGMAPYGYINRTSEDGKKYITVNEPEALVLRWVFKELAKGKYTVEQVFRMSLIRGFSKKRAYFYKLIRNPVYCGKIHVPSYRDEESHFVDGQHEAIIPPSLFYRVQDVLDKRARNYNLKIIANESLPLRGFLICPLCGKALSGSASKGYSKYYTYYHCHSGCSFRLRAEDVNKQFILMLKQYVPKNSMLSVYKQVLLEGWEKQTGNLSAEKKKLQDEIKLIEEKLAYGRELLMAKEIEPLDFREMKEKYNLKLERLSDKLRTVGENHADIKNLLKNGLNALLSLDYIYESGDNEKKQEVITAIFPEKLRFENKVLRTVYVNEAVRLIYMINNKLPENKNGQNGNSSILSTQVRQRRFELPSPFEHNDLNVARLPISPPPLFQGSKVASFSLKCKTIP